MVGVCGTAAVAAVEAGKARAEQRLCLVVAPFPKPVALLTPAGRRSRCAGHWQLLAAMASEALAGDGTRPPLLLHVGRPSAVPGAKFYFHGQRNPLFGGCRRRGRGSEGWRALAG